MKSFWFSPDGIAMIILGLFFMVAVVATVRGKINRP